ncbi:MAG: PepSY domain-containing protein [Nitrospira sp.]|nr:PepSY domain-containing protein [Nitrospira sp.]
MRRLMRGLTIVSLLMFAWPTPIVLADEKGMSELELHNISDAEKVTWARAAKVLITDAIRTATAHIHGQVVQATLESLNGRLLYEIEVVTGEGKVVELFIDPQTGNLIEPGGKK